MGGGVSGVGVVDRAGRTSLNYISKIVNEQMTLFHKLRASELSIRKKKELNRGNEPI